MTLSPGPGLDFKPFFWLVYLCIIILRSQPFNWGLLQYVFSANVMVRVATRPAENPMGIISKKLSLGKSLTESSQH